MGRSGLQCLIMGGIIGVFTGAYLLYSFYVSTCLSLFRLQNRGRFLARPISKISCLATHLLSLPLCGGFLLCLWVRSSPPLGGGPAPSHLRGVVLGLKSPPPLGGSPQPSFMGGVWLHERTHASRIVGSKRPFSGSKQERTRTCVTHCWQ
jgi:hypothetical protein